MNGFFRQVLSAIVIMWSLCAVLTAADVLVGSEKKQIKKNKKTKSFLPRRPPTALPAQTPS